MRRLKLGAIFIVVALLVDPLQAQSASAKSRAVVSPSEAEPPIEGAVLSEPGSASGAKTAVTVTSFPVESLAVTPASDISAGVFGQNTGGGAFTFPGLTGFGTTTPSGRVHLLNGTLNQETSSNDYGAFGSSFYKSRGTVSAKTIVNSGDTIGVLRWFGWDGTAYRPASMVASFVDGTPGANDMPARLAFFTSPDGSSAPTERMRITNAGNVGIGTPTPAYKLHVVGDAFVSGTLSGGNIQAQYQDIAEWVPSTHELDGGAVVVLNRERSNEVTLSSTAYDTTVAGVVSEQPGLTLGVAGDSKEMIATTGRVRVLVDASKAPIRIGDLLVSSDRPGYAMKSMPIEIGGRHMHQPGTIIGKALENLETGEGKILVLLSLQ